MAKRPLCRICGKPLDSQNRRYCDDHQLTSEGKQRKGLAVLPIEERKKIASLGGTEGHRLKRSHEWSVDEAKVAGQLGGRMSRRGPAKKKQVS